MWKICSNEERVSLISPSSYLYALKPYERAHKLLLLLASSISNMLIWIFVCQLYWIYEEEKEQGRLWLTIDSWFVHFVFDGWHINMISMSQITNKDLGHKCWCDPCFKSLQTHVAMIYAMPLMILWPVCQSHAKIYWHDLDDTFADKSNLIGMKITFKTVFYIDFYWTKMILINFKWAGSMLVGFIMVDCLPKKCLMLLILKLLFGWLNVFYYLGWL